MKIRPDQKHAATVVVTRTAKCTCLRCHPTPTVWVPRKVRIDEQGYAILPTLCPRCKSARWWEPAKLKGTSTAMRDYHAKERIRKAQNKSLSDI